jgi:nucleotide-binding universal stress UspA family protein
MFKNILVAIDGSEQSWKVLDLASKLAGATSALHLICVIDPAYTLPDSESLFARQEYPAAACEQHHGQTLMNKALEQLQARGITCSANTLSGGDPARTLCEEAERIDSDLLVIGHRHLSFLGRLLDPSVASKVLDASPCPVLVEVR